VQPAVLESRVFAPSVVQDAAAGAVVVVAGAEVDVVGVVVVVVGVVVVGVVVVGVVAVVVGIVVATVQVTKYWLIQIFFVASNFMNAGQDTLTSFKAPETRVQFR
jgi:hypothetical protein